MKVGIFSAIILLLGAAPALSDSGAGFCLVAAKASRDIMMSRQADIPIDAVEATVLPMFEADLAFVVHHLIVRAYQQPISEGKVLKNLAASAFELATFQDCRGATGQ